MIVMKKKLATIPKIKVSNGSWFIYFSVIDPKTEKMKPIKKYGGFKECANDQERQKLGEKLVKYYTEKLKSGWTPLSDIENIIYSDQLEYQHFSDRFKSQRKASKNTRYFLNEFFTLKATGLEKSSVSTYRSKLRIFCNWLEHKGYDNYDVT
jgi:hypothetical protein